MSHFTTFASGRHIWEWVNVEYTIYQKVRVDPGIGKGINGVWAIGFVLLRSTIPRRVQQKNLSEHGFWDWCLRYERAIGAGKDASRCYNSRLMSCERFVDCNGEPETGASILVRPA